MGGYNNHQSTKRGTKQMNENTNVIAITNRAVNKDRALALVQSNVGLDLSNVRGLKLVGIKNSVLLQENGEWQATAVALYQDKKEHD